MSDVERDLQGLFLVEKMRGTEGWYETRTSGFLFLPLSLCNDCIHLMIFSSSLYLPDPQTSAIANGDRSLRAL